MTRARAEREPGRRCLCFLAPRYWPAWLLLGWMRAAAALPIRWNLRLHKTIGRLAGGVLRRRAHTARRNLEICFPELSRTEIASLLRRHFEALGACLAETAVAWFTPVERLHAMREVDGREHLDAALAEGRGVLLYTAHFTALELTGPLLAALVPRFTFMFSRRRNALLDKMQARGRARVADRSFPKDDVRAMLRSLRENSVVWYAADQADDSSHAALMPFFGEPAMTSTAISRLARMSGAVVVPFFYRRRSDDTGYVLTFHAPLDGFPSPDPVADTRRLVELLEQAIRRAPDQYMWTLKKFRGRPAPWADAYAEPAAIDIDRPAPRRRRRAWAALGAAAGALAFWLSGALEGTRRGIDAAVHGALGGAVDADAMPHTWMAYFDARWLDDIAALVVLIVFAFGFLRGSAREVRAGLAFCLYTTMALLLLTLFAALLPEPRIERATLAPMEFPAARTSALLVIAWLWRGAGSPRLGLVAVLLAAVVALPHLASGAYGISDVLTGAAPLALLTIAALDFTRLGRGLFAVADAASGAVLAGAVRIKQRLGDNETSGGSLHVQVVRGLCIGATQLVPGVSGGTMALMLGVYQRLLSAVARIDGVWVRMLLQARVADALRRLDLLFVLPIMVGILCAPVIFSRALPLEVLVAEMPAMTFGLVFGLVSASIVALLAGIDERRPVSYVWFIGGAVLGCSVVVLVPGETPNGVLFLFLCGAIVAAAMLTPGLSASFALLVLGKYFDVLDAVARADLVVLLPVGAGAIAGIALYSRLMARLLERQRRRTMLTVTGMLGGSLLAVWPFQEWVYAEIGGTMRLVGATPYMPQTLDRGVWMGTAMMLAGFAAYRGLGRLVCRTDSARPANAAPPST